MKKLILLLLLASSFICNAQNKPHDPIPYETKYVCIILSTKSYTEAKKVAQQAGKKCNLKIDYRNLLPNKKIGLTLSKADCENEGWDYPAYYARGRDDDGAFISIEYSNAFDGFAKGYYIVVVAMGDARLAKYVLAEVKPTYKTAYVKKTEVYIGCMH